MSKYNVGDKFVIEIGYGTVDPLYGARYFVKDFNTLVFDDNGLDRLERVNGGPTLRDAYDEGFEKGLKEGRNEKDCEACMDEQQTCDNCRHQGGSMCRTCGDSNWESKDEPQMETQTETKNSNSAIEKTDGLWK